MEDYQIIDLYWNRSENAISETAKKYGAYCRAIAYGILHSREDAEESVNDTWLGAWNSMPPHRPNILSSFLGRITRNLALNTHRNRSTQKRGGGEVVLALEELTECVPAPGDVQDALDARELGRVIQKFLETQPRRERNIFLRRYFGLEPIPVIADRHGITEVNARKILTRVRNKLRDYLTKEGYIV